MGPLKHLTASTVLAALSYLTNEDLNCALSCVAAGTLVDADHLIEYAQYCKEYGTKWDWDEFASGEYFNVKKTVKVLFHSWELALVLWALCLIPCLKEKGILKGGALGYTLHLIMDFFGNNLVDAGYFWLYRYKKKWFQDALTRL